MLGASQSGFGRTGTVDWQTTIKTANFTAVNGEGYFVDTLLVHLQCHLPSPSREYCGFKRLCGTAGTNKITII